jgi:DNA polymerase-3 subunit alpha
MVLLFDIMEIKWIFKRVRRERIGSMDYIYRMLVEYAYLRDIDAMKSIRFVYKIVKLANSKIKIPYFIRGSANSSILCYLLGISHIDPVKHNMILERFINNTRKDLPDIDMDFPSIHRDEMFSRINKKFPNQVARISNKVYYREKSALRQALRDNGYRNFISKYDTFSENLNDLNIVFKVNNTKNTKFKNKIIQDSKKYVDKINYYSLHCGGILFFEKGIPRSLLLECKNTIPQIKYDKYDVEKERLFKVDILSNRAFAALIQMNERDIHNYPETDELTSKILATSVIGITLAESALIGKLCEKYLPKSRYELACILSLARPSSSDNRKTNLSLDKLLSKDIIIFDDDAISYIAEILNCSNDMADKYRKIFAKNDIVGMKNFLELLIKNKVNKIDRNKIMKKLTNLQKYSFCKGHSLAFGYLVWALAYNKAHNARKFWEVTLKFSNTEWRSWVHPRCAKIESGYDLSKGNFNNMFRFKNLGTKEFRQQGLWTGDNFLEGMYFTSNNLNIDEIKFRGLIARVKHGEFNYITIGYDNGKFVDLCTKRPLKEIDLYDGIEGIAFKNKTIIRFNFFKV